MSREQYLKQMYPYAKKAESKTNVPYYFILAQWAWETANGTNRGATQLNNHAGIKFVKSSIALGQDGMYAKYRDKEQFVEDYARVINLSYYKALKTAKTDEELLKAINDSPYAESKYGTGFISIMKQAREVTGGTQETSKVPSMINISTEGLGQAEIEKYALLGLGLITLINLFNRD